MNYIQLSIEADEEQQEILISELSDLEAIGFEQSSDVLLAYFDEDNFRKDEVNKLLNDFDFHITTIPERNWNEVWESNFQPVVIDNFCAIRADFHKPIKHVQHQIIITPKMSFGTGHHATTCMMIEQMRAIDFTDKTVLDFGTGTGILAILAEKLGAASVTAIDNDEWSVKNAKENFEKNKTQSIKLCQSSILPDNKFDVVLANINKNILLHYASTLVNILSPLGILLISGIVKEDETSIANAFSMLQLNHIQQKENWLLLFLINKYNS